MSRGCAIVSGSHVALHGPLWHDGEDRAKSRSNSMCLSMQGCAATHVQITMAVVEIRQVVMTHADTLLD
eukprot:scaffold1399_cov410-Prasinococcus_capsulatus_cf.AAC.20